MHKEKRSFKEHRSFHTKIQISKSQPSLSLWISLFPKTDLPQVLLSFLVNQPYNYTHWEDDNKWRSTLSCARYKCIMCMEMADMAGGVTQLDIVTYFSERSRVVLEIMPSDWSILSDCSSQVCNSVYLPCTSETDLSSPWTCMVNYMGLMVKLSATCSCITPLRISWLNFPFHKSFDNMQNKKNGRNTKIC